MSYLWCGGEDIDFPNGATVSSNTSGAFFRSGFARCGLLANAVTSGAWSNSFPGGGVTSAWLSFRFYYRPGTNPNLRIAGLVSRASGNNSGVWLSNGTADNGFLSLCTWNGSSITTLATSINQVFSTSGTAIYKIDFQITNYGSSATVNVYVNGNIAITYSGSVAVSGVSSLDSVGIFGPTGFSFNSGLSEFIVGTTDTRSVQGLVTMAPNGNGTTQNWSNPAYTNFNPVTINDANSTFVNSTAQDEQATLIDLPSGNFSIPMVKIVARALATTGSSSTNLELGVNNGGTVGVAASHALTTAFTTYEDLFPTDPTTSANWQQSAMNGLQIDLRSA